MLIFWTFYSLENPEKKLISTKTIFTCDKNKKCFLNKLAYYNNQDDWINGCKFSFAIIGINYILISIQLETFY